MSIVDAIQRAKRLGVERATSAHPAGIVAPGSAADVQIEAASRGVVPSVVECTKEIERPNLVQLSYDVAACARYHIVAPGTDEQIMQKASPSYRILRARILQRCRNNNWSTIAITSPGPGEGKSVTAINLAISIAREGNQDVFLIDLDMRNPSVCRYLGITPKVELTSFFSAEAACTDVLFGIGIERFILAGNTLGTNHASELLATDRLEEMLAYIRSISAKPLVIMDMPPILNTDDMLVVAPRIDTTLLVVSEGYTRRDGLEKALGLLSDFNVAGVVLNRTNESVGSEYYGAYT